MHTKLPNLTDLPHDLQDRPHLRAGSSSAFPGSQTPAVVVVRAPNVDTPQMQRAYAIFRRACARDRTSSSRRSASSSSPDRTVARIDFAIAGTGDDEASIAALHTLRDDVIPPIAQTLARTRRWPSRASRPARTTSTSRCARGCRTCSPFVLGLAFVLLLLTFRSLVIAATAVALNLLSVGAAYGILVAGLPARLARGPLGFQTNGAIVSWLPLFLFVVLFGLSMDYHVFILSRIKELHDAGVTTDDAIRLAITRTAGTVTSAAIIMVAVFGLFATLSLIMLQQLGFGLAIAVLIDATVVRAVLVPSTMKLLGEWNWYLPRWLSGCRRSRRKVQARRAKPCSSSSEDSVGTTTRSAPKSRSSSACAPDADPDHRQDRRCEPPRCPRRCVSARRRPPARRRAVGRRRAAGRERVARGRPSRRMASASSRASTSCSRPTSSSIGSVLVLAETTARPSPRVARRLQIAARPGQHGQAALPEAVLEQLALVPREPVRSRCVRVVLRVSLGDPDAAAGKERVHTLDAQPPVQVRPVVGLAVEWNEVPARVVCEPHQVGVEDLRPGGCVQHAAVREDAFEVEDTPVDGLFEAEHRGRHGTCGKPRQGIDPAGARELAQQRGRLPPLGDKLLTAVGSLRGHEYRRVRVERTAGRVECCLPTGADRVQLSAARTLRRG